MVHFLVTYILIIFLLTFLYRLNQTKMKSLSLKTLGLLGAIVAVEKALKAFTDENIGVELEDFVVSGRNRIMILGVDQN